MPEKGRGRHLAVLARTWSSLLAASDRCLKLGRIPGREPFVVVAKLARLPLRQHLWSISSVRLPLFCWANTVFQRFLLKLALALLSS